MIQRRFFFKTPARQYVIIDAPGHVEFIKNMITGATQAEAAVLIIDVQEGIKEQTRRHAYILSLFGISQVIVALNKMDLVDFKEKSFNEVKKETEEFFSFININPTLYIPICAINGENVADRSKDMDWYTGPTFLEGLDRLKNIGTAEDKPLIFPVQDIYKIDNRRIIVGRIEAGFIRKGQEVKILPSQQVTKIKTIESYSKQIEMAYAKESTGITLEDSLFIDRGDVIC